MADTCCTCHRAEDHTLDACKKRTVELSRTLATATCWHRWLTERCPHPTIGGRRDF